MTPDEQRLIDDLFDRLSQQGGLAKDRQADALIQQRLRQTPDAAYMLVQSAIVYQHQIAANEDRIRDLEEQLNASDVAPERGSFLGGLLGGGVSGGRASVPASGRPVRSAAAPSASPWGQAGGQAPAPAARGGGFLSNALTTAAGVAGGMLVADSLRGMFGGDAKPGDTQAASSASDQAALKDADATQDELQDAQLADDDYGSGDDGGGIDI